MGTAQIVIICIICCNVGVAMANHGMPRRNYNGLEALFDAAIMAALLWWGGFWASSQ